MLEVVLLVHQKFLKNHLNPLLKFQEIGLLHGTSDLRKLNQLTATKKLVKEQVIIYPLFREEEN